jgi:hypothetical protein
MRCLRILGLWSAEGCSRWNNCPGQLGKERQSILATAINSAPLPTLVSANGESGLRKKDLPNSMMSRAQASLKPKGASFTEAEEIKRAIEAFIVRQSEGPAF